MKRTTRWAAVAVLLLAILVVAMSANSEWVKDAGLDLWHAPALNAELDQGKQRREALDARLQTSRESIARKSEIADDVIAGRYSLSEASREFRGLNVSNPDFVRVMRYKYPTCSEDELHIHNVIDTIDRKLQQKSNHDEIVARLTAEFEFMLRDGAMQLTE